MNALDKKRLINTFLILIAVFGVAVLAVCVSPAIPWILFCVGCAAALAYGFTK